VRTYGADTQQRLHGGRQRTEVNPGAGCDGVQADEPADLECSTRGHTVSSGIIQKTGTPVFDSGSSAAGCGVSRPSGAASLPEAAVAVVCGDWPRDREDGPGTTLEVLCGLAGAPMPAPRLGRPVSTSGPAEEAELVADCPAELVAVIASTEEVAPRDGAWQPLPFSRAAEGPFRSDCRSPIVRRLRRVVVGTGGRVDAGRSRSAVSGPRGVVSGQVADTGSAAGPGCS